MTLRFASTTAYTTLGLLRAKSSPMRPSSPSGNPSSDVSRFQVSPPSTERCSPLPGPPEVKNHGHRRCSHMAAMSLLGFDGSMTRSPAPVRSLT